MTFVHQQMPVCTMFNYLFTKLKISFHCANEVFLPLFLCQVFLLLLYFKFTLLIRPKNACKGSFCNFFYLHADKQGKTRSSLYWQTSFPRWTRGKVIVFRLAHIDFSFGWIADRSSPTDRLDKIGPRSTQNSSQSWAWSAGKH